MGESTAKLTSAEISNLWMNYQNDTMAKSVMSYFVAHMEDNDIRSVFEYALNISDRHIVKVTEFLKTENYPIPVGFTDNDVNLDAPPFIYRHSVSSLYP